MSILIFCAKSDVMSQCVLCLSGMTDQLRRKKKRCMRLIGTLQEKALFEMNHESYCDEETLKMIKKGNLEADVMKKMFTPSWVIDEAGHASVKVTLEEPMNDCSNRTTMQVTLVGINTLEEWTRTVSWSQTSWAARCQNRRDNGWADTFSLRGSMEHTKTDVWLLPTLKGTCNNEQGCDICGQRTCQQWESRQQWRRLDHDSDDTAGRAAWYAVLPGFWTVWADAAN